MGSYLDRDLRIGSEGHGTWASLPEHSVEEYGSFVSPTGVKPGDLATVKGLAPQVEKLAEGSWSGAALGEHEAGWLDGTQRIDAPLRLRVGAMTNQRWSEADSGGDHDDMVSGEHFDMRRPGDRRSVCATHGVHWRSSGDERTCRTRLKALSGTHGAKARKVARW